MARVNTLKLITLSVLFITFTPGLSLSVSKQQACLSSEFSCPDGRCLSHSSRCDHWKDCSDGSDEENCDQDECKVNNGGCSHVCVNLTPGVLCECPVGMRLIHDTKCEEVNPCLDTDVCDQLCVHSNGTLTCKCLHGYLKNSDSGRCLAEGGAVLIFSSSEGLAWMNGSGSDQKLIWERAGSGGGSVTALPADHTVYWTDPDHSLIYRLALDRSDQGAEVIHRGSGGITGLSLDWIHHRLYWISNRTRSVHLAALDGSESTELITGLSNPTAVTVQPLMGLLFWADDGVPPRIERSGLGGENRTSLVTSTILHPAFITLDVPRDLLYWVDSGLHIISRVRYDGQHRKTVVPSNGYLDRPLGLAVFEDRVYWSDGVTGSICSADKHRGGNLQVVRVSLGTPSGLVIYHPLLQPTDSNSESESSSDLTESAPGNTDGTSLTDSTFTWTLSLIVLLCVVGAAVTHRCWRTGAPAAFSLSRSNTKESRDPLVPTGLTGTPQD